MSKYSLVKLMEQEGMEDDATFSVGKATYDLVVTPVDSTPEDIIAALDNIDNYGIYASNIRNTATNKATINKAVEDHFGPNIPAKKKSLEKQRGVPFPPKTKQAIDDFVKQFSSKPQLLKPTVEGDIVIFKQKENPTKDVTKKILQVVLNNAEIKYKVSEKESI
jgi:hypothetical protein